MIDVACVIGACLPAFLQDNSKAAITAVFTIIAALSFYFIVKADKIRSKIKWSYLSVFSLVFLITYFAFSMTCHKEIPVCGEQAVMYSVPLAIVGSIVFGYVILPYAYLKWNKTVISKELTKSLPYNVPVYISDNGKPFACSYGGFKKWIIVSQGMLDILTKKELQSVLLHEYGHLASHSSFYSLSSWLYVKVPLLQEFFNRNAFEDEEERYADSYAVSMQKTTRYIDSAKKKLQDYHAFR